MSSCSKNTCEVCGEPMVFEPDTIIQWCDVCREIFSTEMGKIEFDEIYKDIRINIIKDARTSYGSPKSRREKGSA